MTKKKDPLTTWQLLRPHVRPMIPLLMLTTLIGLIGAAAESSVLLLITPIFNLILFQDGVEADLGSEAALMGVGEINNIDRFFQFWGEGIRGLSDAAWLQDPRMGVLIAVLISVFALTIVAAGCLYVFNQLSSYVSLKLVIGFRLRLTKHLMGLDLAYHGSRKLGDLLSRISADIQKTLEVTNIWFREYLRNGFKALVLLGVAATSELYLTLIMLVALPALAIPVRILSKRVRRRSTKSHISLGASVQVLTQMFLGIRTVKAFRAEEEELKRYSELNETYLNDSMRTVRAVSLTQAWATMYTQLGLGLLLFAIGAGAIYGDYFDDAGTLYTFLIANAQCFTHIKRLTRAITNIEESVGASIRLKELLDESPQVKDAAKPLQLSTFKEGLSFEDVSFSYPTGDGAALANVNLNVKRGETLAIVGSSGSGKSTLMGLVCRFYDPSQGKVTADGHDLKDISLDSWTSMFSMVDQSPFLFHTSIAENLRYAKRDATDEELYAACRAAQIHDFIEELPDGYDTNVADAGARLSGGQRQRITIARALLKGSPLLLLDEATSALDTESERGVQLALETLMEGRTVIVIAHRLSTIQNADRIAVFEHGKIVEVGTHAELNAKGGAYARALDLQKIS